MTIIKMSFFANLFKKAPPPPIVEAPILPVDFHLGLFGDPATGKTSAARCFGENYYSSDYIPSAYNEYSTTCMMNNQTLNLKIHDFGGKYVNQLKPFIKTIPFTAIAIFFSYYEKGSLDRAINYWFPLAEEVAPDAPAFFVCTKIDLMLSPFLEETELFERVSEERANMMSRLEEVDSIFYECSSMSKEGIEETFDSIMLTTLVMQQAKLPRLEYPPSGIKIPGVENTIMKPAPKLDAKGRPIPE